MKYSYDADMTKVAQLLRKQSTPEENKLWYQYLRSYPIQFRRQRPFGRYVLDFYCPKARLGIELDGSQHFTSEGMQSDANRTAFLAERGIEIIRFTNHEINTQFDAVCRAIDAAVRSKLEQTPHPSSR